MDKMKKITMLFFLVVCTISLCWGQEYFPDIPGYETLICDFHMHTVFSDGLVWPTVRVDEARREGLDAIALTDHIEYQPHKDDIPTNHRRPIEIAQKRAEEKDVLLIRGAEITRETPPGHYNALFLDNIDLLNVPEFLKAVEKANEQHAFVFWNHHAWKGLDRGKWTDLQTKMVNNKWLHGMEVANGSSYYPNAHAWCLEKNLTMLGNSDIHDPSIDYIYTAKKHRTLTLVFAKERSIPAIHEALQAGRTAVWLENQLIGREEYLRPLFEKSVTIETPYFVNDDGDAVFKVTNHALIDFKLHRNDHSENPAVEIPARSSVTIKEHAPDAVGNLTLSYSVANLLMKPKKGLPVKLMVAAEPVP